MFFNSMNSIYRTKEILDQSEKYSKASLYQKTINLLINPTDSMSETEKKEYEQKISQKLKIGKQLTSEELAYLRVYNPEMYKIAIRVEASRKALKTQLANCKSKEEVQQVFVMRVQVIQTMKDDPAREAMTAMVNREMKEFRKSREYAKLPLTVEESKKKVKASDYEAENREIEASELKKAVFYQRMQRQCDLIAEITQRVLAA